MFILVAESDFKPKKLSDAVFSRASSSLRSEGDGK